MCPVNHLGVKPAYTSLLRAAVHRRHPVQRRLERREGRRSAPLHSICVPRYGRPPTVPADRRSEMRCVLHLLEIDSARI
jgi:hypothetical protein